MTLAPLEKRYEAFCQDAEELLELAGLARDDQDPKIIGRGLYEASVNLASIHWSFRVLRGSFLKEARMVPNPSAQGSCAGARTCQGSPSAPHSSQTRRSVALTGPARRQDGEMPRGLAEEWLGLPF